MNGSDAIRFECPQCGKGLRVASEAAGKRVRCPKCSEPAVVPLPLEDEGEDDAPRSKTPSTPVRRKRTRPREEEEDPQPRARNALLPWLAGGAALLIVVVGLTIWLASGSKKAPAPVGPPEVASAPTKPSNPEEPPHTPLKEPEPKPDPKPKEPAPEPKEPEPKPKEPEPKPKEKAGDNTEDEVVEFLATREMLQGVLRDHGQPGGGTLLKPHFIHWVALGVNEPFDQRIALAQVVYMGQSLKDKKFFDTTHTMFVSASLDSGIFACNISQKLLREKSEFAKAFLSVANQDLASDVSQELIASVGTDITFDSELAGYTAKTHSMMKKLDPSKVADAHSALRKAIREALAKHPDLAESLKRNIALTAAVRPSHERVGKLIRAASGG